MHVLLPNIPNYSSLSIINNIKFYYFLRKHYHILFIYLTKNRIKNKNISVKYARALVDVSSEISRENTLFSSSVPSFYPSIRAHSCKHFFKYFAASVFFAQQILTSMIVHVVSKTAPRNIYVLKPWIDWTRFWNFITISINCVLLRHFVLFVVF